MSSLPITLLYITPHLSFTVPPLLMSLFRVIHYVCSCAVPSPHIAPRLLLLHQEEPWLFFSFFPPCLQLNAPLFSLLSFLSLLSILLFLIRRVLEAGCKTGCLVQPETNPAATVVFLLRQSPISLFILSVRACVFVWLCVCAYASVCVLRMCVTLALQSQVMISSPRQ